MKLLPITTAIISASSLYFSKLAGNGVANDKKAINLYGDIVKLQGVELSELKLSKKRDCIPNTNFELNKDLCDTLELYIKDKQSQIIISKATQQAYQQSSNAKQKVQAGFLTSGIGFATITVGGISYMVFNLTKEKAKQLKDIRANRAIRLELDDLNNGYNDETTLLIIRADDGVV